MKANIEYTDGGMYLVTLFGDRILPAASLEEAMSLCKRFDHDPVYHLFGEGRN